MTQRRQVALLTFDHAPTASELEAVEATFEEEGFEAPATIPMPRDINPKTGWDVRIIADMPGPYARRIQ